MSPGAKPETETPATPEDAASQETNAPPAAPPADGRKRAEPRARDKKEDEDEAPADVVEEAGRESFPASDPPSWMP